MLKLTPLHRLALLSCVDDYTGIWEFALDVQQQYPEANRSQIQSETLVLIRDLLEAGYIIAGDLKDNVGVIPWPSPVEETIRRIKQEWDSLGREPTIWEIVWFDSTAAGDQALREGQERNVLKESD